jgi:hypothetical protein
MFANKVVSNLNNMIVEDEHGFRRNKERSVIYLTFKILYLTPFCDQHSINVDVIYTILVRHPIKNHGCNFDMMCKNRNSDITIYIFVFWDAICMQSNKCIRI